MKVICIEGKNGAGDALCEFTEQGIPFEFHSVGNFADALQMSNCDGSDLICKHDVRLLGDDSLLGFTQLMISAKVSGFGQIKSGESIMSILDIDNKNLVYDCSPSFSS